MAQQSSECGARAAPWSKNGERGDGGKEAAEPTARIMGKRFP